MTDYDNSPVPFEATFYEYEVRLGTVMDRKCISWGPTFRMDDWKGVQRLVSLWQNQEDYPAVEVNIDYIPHRIPNDVETGP